MKVELRPGLQGRAEAIVDTTNVAAVMGSGDLDVFATPAMIALMEQAACNAILPCLDSSTSSVGIKMDTTHEAATLLGKKIIAFYSSDKQNFIHWHPNNQAETHVLHFNKSVNDLDFSAIQAEWLN